MTPRYDLSEAALARDCEVEYFVGGGPGGQHRNKTSTGVRILHRPSGVVCTATRRRSQSQNEADALERLRERLTARMHVPKRRVATRPGRGATERRLAQKKRAGERKRERRTGDSE